jgi:hypothetical protein
LDDVAPGACLAFRTAWRGEADFAAGILELTAAGSDVIVDDIIYYEEPMFKDGVVAQAADEVVSQEIPFFSVAGTEARNSWVAASGFSIPPVWYRAKWISHHFHARSYSRMWPYSFSNPLIARIPLLTPTWF